MTAAQLAEMEAMTDADVLAVAYSEAAGGDVGSALLNAVRDLLALEAEAEATAGLVSHGYVRGAVPVGKS